MLLVKEPRQDCANEALPFYVTENELQIDRFTKKRLCW